MFMIIEADSLDAKARARGETALATQDSGHSPWRLPIRRPYRGIQIKDDTYAFLSIYRATDNKPVEMRSSSRVRDGLGRDENNIGYVAQYADFILQAVEDARTEKMQIIETFGESYVYFFGEKPRVVMFSGVLINSEDFNWRSQFWYNYENYFRGTKLVQRNARAYIAYDSIVIEGYPISASASDSADQPHIIPFRLTMLVTNYFDYSNIGSVRYPGYDQVNTAALNRELEAIKIQRKSYISTSADVRRRNLTASPAGGILSEVRKGIRAVNEIAGAAGAFMDSIFNFVGGRTVRLPIGVAGYLQTVGAATVAGGSVGPDSILNMYDASTGKYKTLNGKLKIRMPGNAWFNIPSSGFRRGRISDNVDEYPLAKETSLTSLLNTSDYINYRIGIATRNALTKSDAIALDAWNSLAETGSLLASISEVADGLRAGFAIVMSTVGFLKDPMGSLRAMLGFDPKSLLNNPFKSLLYQARPEDLMEYKLDESIARQKDILGSAWARNPTLVKKKMKELGLEVGSYQQLQCLTRALGTDSINVRSPEYIRDQMDRAGLKEIQDIGEATLASSTARQDRLNFIGEKAGIVNESFQAKITDEKLKLDLFGDPDTEVEVGVVYESGQYLSESTDMGYRKTYAEDYDYEEVYGDSDYTSLAARSDLSASAMQLIKEAYDDLYTDKPSDVTEQSIESVYGDTYASRHVKSSAEILELLKKLLERSEQLSEVSYGIRGVDDEDAEIEPVK